MEIGIRYLKVASKNRSLLECVLGSRDVGEDRTHEEEGELLL